MSKLESIMNGWYGRLDDMKEDIEELGYEVIEMNREYISCYSEEEDDTEYVIKLGGTERTIIAESIREVRV